MKWLVGIVGVLVLLVLSYSLYARLVSSPADVNQLLTNPQGERAGRVMLLEFADMRIPVNYLREGNQVFVGADGSWRRAFRDEGAPVSVLIRGESLTGHAMVVLDDPAYVEDVFSRLRPAVPDWLPDWLNGKLVVITLSTAQ